MSCGVIVGSCGSSYFNRPVVQKNVDPCFPRTCTSFNYSKNRINISNDPCYPKYVDKNSVEAKKFLNQQKSSSIKKITKGIDGLCYGVKDDTFTIYSFSQKKTISLSLDVLTLLLNKGASFYGIKFDKNENTLYLQPNRAKDILHQLKEEGVSIKDSGLHLKEMIVTKKEIGCFDLEDDDYDRD